MKVNIVNFLFLKFEIGLFLLFKSGLGHLKPDLFNKDIKSQKKGRSCSLTLFSKIVKIYFLPSTIII